MRQKRFQSRYHLKKDVINSDFCSYFPMSAKVLVLVFSKLQLESDECNRLIMKSNSMSV